jgi:glycosyltransferase involved in cell wall biosynthesis
MSQDLLSVCLITYNHGKFIAEAIDSVLMQKTNFDFQLVIADDCSRDETREIIKTYKSKYPQKIQLILQDENVGAARNWMQLLDFPESKYIAYLEGDDYWTEPYKLQKQVDFMEENQDFAMCFHAVNIKFASATDFYEYPIPPSDILYLKDIVKEHYIPSCSLMFRNTYYLNGYPHWLVKTISGDIPHEILLASKGKTKYFSEKMACYRRNLGSVTQVSSLSSKMRAGYIDMYAKIASEIGGFPKLYLHAKCIKLRLGYLKDFLRKRGMIK